jgi:hypothetical protein
MRSFSRPTEFFGPRPDRRSFWRRWDTERAPEAAALARRLEHANISLRRFSLELQAAPFATEKGQALFARCCGRDAAPRAGASQTEVLTAVRPILHQRLRSGRGSTGSLHQRIDQASDRQQTHW